MKYPKRPSARRICKVVESICLGFSTGGYNIQSMDTGMKKIYRFVHLQSDCENPHYDWREEFEEIERGIKK